MRKILFRGKDVNGKWRYGYLRTLGGVKNIAIMEKYSQRSYKVDSKTIGQYIGFDTYSKFNKKKHKLFEGDICRVTVFDTNTWSDKTYICEVVFLRGGFILEIF